ncbi:MAG: carboxypeptidase-like regulatory domain-containing protein, partial [Bacteroidota bacterium]
MSRSIFKMRYLLVLTLFLFSQKFFAQISISGQVVNADKEAIEFANVYLKNTESGKIITGEISNEKGDFLLKTTETGSHTLTISFLGYEDWTKVLEVGSEDIKLGAIGLSSSASTMEEVVVTAEREVIEKKADRLVFNVEKSPLKTGFDGLEVLRRSPNILIDVNGEILMRKEVPTIMINGRISSLSGQELASYLRNLRSDDIQKIEVQTHLGVNTQSESSGGVINIILKKKPVGFTGNVTSYHAMAGGGFTRTSLGTNFNYGAEKWNVYGTLSYRFAETELTYDENILNYNREVSPNFIRNLHIWEESLATQNYKLGFVADPFKNHVFGFEGYVRVQNENVDNDGTISAEHNGTELDVG